MPPKSQKPWTAEEDEQLRVRIKRHEQQFKIAKALGRTFAAVGARAQQLELKLAAPLRPSHFK